MELEEIRKKCICGTCKSFNECMKNNGQGGFCVVGKSSCTVNQFTCECPKCPNAQTLKLKESMYCKIGVVMEKEKLAEIPAGPAPHNETVTQRTRPRTPE